MNPSSRCFLVAFAAATLLSACGSSAASPSPSSAVSPTAVPSATPASTPASGQSVLDFIDGFSGPYHGTWKNTTFGSTGTAATDVTVDRGTSTVTFQLTLTGSVFGGSAPAPETFHGTFDANSVKFSGTSATFGTYTIAVDNNGMLTMSCPAVPGDRVKSVTITGPVTGDTVNLTYVVSFKSGGSDANGTITLGR